MEKVISFCLLLYLALFPFGQLTRGPFYLFKSPEINLYLTDIVLFCLLFFWFVWRKCILKKRYQLPRLAKPIFLFLLIALSSLLINFRNYSGREILVSGLYLVRWILYGSLYFIISDLKTKFKYLNRQNITRFLIVIGVVYAIFGLLQYWFWPDISLLTVMGWDPHYYRIVGTFLDPGFSGIIYVLTLILLLSEKPFPPINYWLSAISFFALALTYSRSSYLAFLIAMTVIALMKKQLKFLLLACLLMALTVLILPRYQGGEGVKLERTASVQARADNWQKTFLIARDHFWLGVGFNTLRYVKRDYDIPNKDWQTSHAGAGADSSLLFVFATTGVAGLAAYLWLWLKMFRFSRRFLAIFATLMALMVHSWFLNSLFYPWVMAWLWLLLAMENS